LKFSRVFRSMLCSATTVSPFPGGLKVVAQPIAISRRMLRRERGMPIAAKVQLSFLDGPTVAFVAVCIVALLGLMLILAWLQQRDARALAWWGAAYLIGASSLALWGAPEPWLSLPPEVPFAMIFVACGMIWNGVRLFRSRPLLPVAAFSGAIVWLLLCQLPLFADGSAERIVLGALV